MKTYKKRKICITVITISVLLVVFFESYKGYFIDPTYEKYTWDELTVEQQEQLKPFYETGESLISYGELFDLKFILYDEEDKKNSFIEVVKKTKDPVEYIHYVSSSTEEGEVYSYSFLKDAYWEEALLQKDEIYTYSKFGAYSFFTDDIKKPEKLTIKIEYPGGEEVHYLEANIEEQIKANKESADIVNAKKYAFNSPKTNVGTSFYLINYFNMLYRSDIEAWDKALEDFYSEINVAQHETVYAPFSLMGELTLEKAEKIEDVVNDFYNSGFIDIKNKDIKTVIECLKYTNKYTNRVKQEELEKIYEEMDSKNFDVSRLIPILTEGF